MAVILLKAETTVTKGSIARREWKGDRVPLAATRRLGTAQTRRHHHHPLPPLFSVLFFLCFLARPGEGGARPVAVLAAQGAGRLPQGRLTPKLTCRYGA